MLQLLKAWRAHEKWLRSSLVAALILALALVRTVSAFWTSKKMNDQARTIKSLTTAVETANKNQAQNTKQFTEAFEHFSAKLNELETGVKTADLRDQAKLLQEELTQTQKALFLRCRIICKLDQSSLWTKKVTRFVAFILCSQASHNELAQSNQTSPSPFESATIDTGRIVPHGRAIHHFGNRCGNRKA